MDDFFEKLAKYKGMFEIVALGGSKPQYIRKCNATYCPLEVVGGIYWWSASSENLLLSYEERKLIVRAADKSFGYDESLRNRLLLTLGLEEPA